MTTRSLMGEWENGTAQYFAVIPCEAMGSCLV